MTPLKWFAGGSERRCEAMTIIDHLLEDIKVAFNSFIENMKEKLE